MRGFDFVNAPTLDAATELLEEHGEHAKAVAGGTDALGTLKDRVHAGHPEMLVNLKTIEGLDYIRPNGQGLAIGSLTRIHALETDPAILLLREIGAWPDISDRISRHSRYLRAVEHSAQIAGAELTRVKVG